MNKASMKHTENANKSYNNAVKVSSIIIAIKLLSVDIKNLEIAGVSLNIDNPFLITGFLGWVLLTDVLIMFNEAFYGYHLDNWREGTGELKDHYPIRFFLSNCIMLYTTLIAHGLIAVAGLLVYKDMGLFVSFLWERIIS